MKKYYFLIFIILLFFPLASKGAILYLELENNQYHQGDTFLIEIRLDTKGEYINTIEANLSFPSDILKVQDLSTGNSILNLWIQEPSFSDNEISFIGGLPGGYQGIGGLIGKIAFKALKPGNVKIVFQEDSKVLLNDGKGTQADLDTKGAVFNILSEELEIPKDEWEKIIEEDNILPEAFKPEISQDPSIFKGKYFIIFSTTDKQSGIDHYEIKEGERDWEIAVSPYVLKNQRLTVDIWVKAVDKAGNEWIEIIEAQKKPVMKYIVLVLLLLCVIIIVSRKIRKL